MLKQKRMIVVLSVLLTLVMTSTSILSFTITGNAAGSLTSSAVKKENTNEDEKPKKDAYQIQINKKTNCVTVFEKGEDGKYKNAVKAFVCSTGEDTPLGTYHTMNIFRWQPLMGDVYGQYCTQIVGNILFHSVYYSAKDPSKLDNGAYNVLGKTASHGCIRLCVKDAKWLYDNCGIGTTVKIINGKEKDDVLGKPKALKTNNGWDPTDPSSKNPWKNCFLTTTVLNKKIECGTKINWKKVFSVVDAADRVVSSKYYKVKGKVNTNKIGSYKVTVTTTDKKNVVKTKKITIKVVNSKPPVLSGVQAVTIERCSVFDMMKGVSAKSANGTKIKKKYITVSGSVVNANCGSYTLTYQAKDPKNNKVTKQTRVITVVDTTMPIIAGVADKTLTLPVTSLEPDRQNAIMTDVKSLITVTDNGEIVTEKALITVSAKENNTYQVVVSYVDQAGNKTKMNAVYQIALN